MEKNKKILINFIAKKVREVLNLNFPTEINLAVEKLGGEIDINSLLEEDKEAQIIPNGDGFRIIIDASKPENRKIFSIAHELGHLFLHMGYLHNDEKWNNASKSTYYRCHDLGEDEIEANEFAAAFLMPEEKYAEKLSEGLNISEMSKYFGVSEAAIINRGRFLGYISKF